MASVNQSPEVKSILKQTPDLTTALSNDPLGVAGRLLSKELICREVYSKMLIGSYTQAEKAAILVEAVGNTIEIAPVKFQYFLEILSEVVCAIEVVGRLRSTYQEFDEELTQQIQQRNQQLEREKQQMERERDQAIQEKIEKERQLGRVNQQLEESERLIADFGKRNRELEEEIRVLRSQVQGKDGGAKAGAVSRTDFKLRWREGERAPCEMGRYCDAVVHNDTVYCKYTVCKVYAYHISSSSWSLTPDTPGCRGFALAVVDDLLTTVGGYGGSETTNKLFSLTGEGSGRRWTEKFPPMPTKRYYVSALCTRTILIVAGGNVDDNNAIQTVEVLNTETREWHTAADLPQPLSSASIALCGDLVYLLGGFDRCRSNTATNLVYTCSLTSLSSTGSTSLGERVLSALTRSFKIGPWNRVADLPVKVSTAVSLHGRLLAIGGVDSNGKQTTAIHMYQPTTNSWEVISHMTTPRYHCLSAVLLADNQLMVVGGSTTVGEDCDLVEFGTVF